MSRTLVALVIAVALAGCSDPSETIVTMTSAQRFDPDEITVTVGEKVVWTNESSQSHTVTAYEDQIPSGATYFASGATSEQDARDELAGQLIEPDGRFNWTFEEPGTYAYFCIPHEDQGMVGTIVVEE
jgi:plastocyanin